jgi:hypothetical protein
MAAVWKEKKSWLDQNSILWPRAYEFTMLPPSKRAFALSVLIYGT